MNRIIKFLSLSRLGDAEKRHSCQTMSKLLTIFIFLVVMFLVNCRQSHGHTKIPKKDNANIRGHKSKRVVTKSTLHLPGVPGKSRRISFYFRLTFLQNRTYFNKHLLAFQAQWRKLKARWPQYGNSWEHSRETKESIGDWQVVLPRSHPWDLESRLFYSGLEYWICW